MLNDQPICPVTKAAIEAIAHCLRTLPCDNSLVSMNLHRVARELEAIAATHVQRDARSGSRLDMLEARQAAARAMWSAQECSE